MDLDTTKCFFHYTTRDAAFEHILPTGKLRFSKLEQMRDPMESKDLHWPAGWFPVGEDENVKQLAYSDFARAATEIRRRTHLLALTVDALGYSPGAEAFAAGWSRARMWEHYAEQHAGVCLIFDRRSLTDNLTADLEDQTGSRPFSEPVTYTETGDEQAPFLDLTSIPDDIAGSFVPEFIEQNYFRLFFEKALDWETEHEYRFVTTAPADDPLYVDYGDALVGVVVGEKFPDWQKPAAIEAGRRAGVVTHILNWEMRRPLPTPLKLSDGVATESR